ncbi:hypothetical protein DFH11DRAFT_1841724 [Phellopilus nigrolimitatus]|nr:hypothetical protein DFH11DRAFT_1841724 [Phellopilus nigrolimitatus]
MRAPRSPLVFLLASALLLATTPGCVHAAPNALPAAYPDALGSSDFGLAELSPLILLHHKPTPPSYGTHDFEDPDVAHRYPYLMGLHILFMCSAFFGALPVGIALRSVSHGLHGLSVIVFYALVGLGLACSALYKKLTPNMYEGAKHGVQGYFVLFIANVLTTIDAFATIVRAFHFFTAVRRGEIAFSVRAFWKNVVLSKDNDVDGGAKAHEYTGLVFQEPEEMDVQELKAVGDIDDHIVHHALSGLQSPVSEEDNTELWANDVHSLNQQHRARRSDWRHSITSDGTLFQPPTERRSSRQSDETLHELPAHVKAAKAPLILRIGRGAFATTERVLLFLGYMQVLTGLVTYTGACRGSYVNGCLAHLIKGGIFWSYGLVTFARFLGSFSELGWAWNRAPRSDKRFGVKAGTPFSTKEVQHISIAVMFWFAGLVGMGIESKTIRRWLSAPAATLASSSPSAQGELIRPASYRASFNPFPALVIGVTGLAMAAHMQVYLFQVQIHSLWGQLLAGFALLRCLTYFFLWLSPPSSVLPSRPPTEALASFFLACGGLVFQFSTEELTIAAMRRKHDDVMMFLNLAVAVTCLAFCWVLAVVAFKAWLKMRQTAKNAAAARPRLPTAA